MEDDNGMPPGVDVVELMLLWLIYRSTNNTTFPSWLLMDVSHWAVGQQKSIQVTLELSNPNPDYKSPARDVSEEEGKKAHTFQSIEARRWDKSIHNFYSHSFFWWTGITYKKHQGST
jgi:hypothetical protein